MSDSSASAFVPGHITGFFSTYPADDPTKAGSRGGGLALSTGVRVTISQGDGVELDGDRIEVGAVDRVLDTLGVGAHVAVETDLPLGAGFGVSGAMALGVALTANAAFDRQLSTNELVTVAHGAEVQAGTGLGDVVAQARGGVPIRLDPGAPPHGTLDAIPARSRVEFITFGELSTEEVLSGDTHLLSEAGERALAAVVSEPTIDSFVRASRQFAREAGLLTDRVRETIEDVHESGGDASMSMLGETVFALGTGLTDAGYDAEVCEVHPAGATLLPNGE